MELRRESELIEPLEDACDSRTIQLDPGDVGHSREGETGADPIIPVDEPEAEGFL